MKRQRQQRGWRLSSRARKTLFIIALAVISLFVAANGTLWFLYRGRTYPRTKVIGKNIGSIEYSQLSAKVSRMKLLPQDIHLTYDQQNIVIPLEELGVSSDPERAVKSAYSQRSWLPLVNVIRSPELKAPVRIDPKRFNTKAQQISQQLRKDPANAHVTLTGTEVGIQQGADGYELQQSSLQQTVLAALDAGKDTVAAPVSKTLPKVQADSLKSAKLTLENQLKTSVTFRYNGKIKQASSTDIATWFAPAGETLAVSTPSVQAYVASVGKEFGIRIKDSVAVAASAGKAVSDQKTFDVMLVAQTAVKTFTYCVAAKGVDTSYLPVLRSKLAATYGDARGWGLDGLVDFKEMTSGCNFTVWLSASSLMPSFGAICDSMWSCRVGPNVVINFDRWQNASPSWNANGGTLEDYRHMVINHETGHWLGFDHDHCGGPGQLAPVMQQQSIDLQGCTFNPWPVKDELNNLRHSLGI